MASVTRSRQRAEALQLHPHQHAHPHHHHHHQPGRHPRSHLTATTTTSLNAASSGTNSGAAAAAAVAAAALFQQQSNPPNRRSSSTTTTTTTTTATKRPLVIAADRDFDVGRPKKTRISVEIFAKGSMISNDAIAANARVPPTPAPAPAPASARPPPRPRPAVATTTTTTKNTPVNPPPVPTTTAIPTPTPVPTPADDTDQALTKHQAKVINGIKHELDRLQPASSDAGAKEQGRKLRSQEATRFKSELSAYFPDYDEVIGNEPKEQHLLNVDTPILVVDSDPRRAGTIAQRAAQQRPHPIADEYQSAVRGYGDALFSDVFDAQVTNFSFLEAQYKNKTPEDPLPDSLFQPAHKRAERLERSIRNTEKGRAQHEKDQIIRLLEGLQGHDWLRVMGVSGITETRKKTFEPARDHFIKGCQAILDKFRNWSLEEKRRKQEKEKALAEEKAEKEEQQGKSDEEEEQDGSDSDEETGRAEDDEVQGGDGATDSNSDSSSPAKQLREEAMARSKAASRGTKRRRPTPQPRVQKAPQPPKPPEPPKEFKSFFSKKYERDGALGRHRRAGRKVLAWGHPIPEIPEQDFDLPEEYRDEETLKTRARKKRRDKRGSRH